MRLALALVPLLLTALVPAVPATTGVTVEDFDITVYGEPAHGLLATPASEPTAIVVVAHGYGHTAESHRAHLEQLAQRGAVAVAMDYRGTGFPLRAGADDTIAATLTLIHRYPDVETVILYSVSMGTAVAGMVLSELPVYDHWVSNEGLSMLHETWAGASALAPFNAYASQAQADIEAECGGTPAQAWMCYRERSAALRLGDTVTMCGEDAHMCTPLQGAYLAHGLVDGLVPYDQGRELAATLRTMGVPTDFYTVARGEPGGEGTTITGYAGFQVDGLAGHGTESDDAHTLTALTFGLLYDLVEGDLAPASDREILVDRAGTLG